MDTQSSRNLPVPMRDTVWRIMALHRIDRALFHGSVVAYNQAHDAAQEQRPREKGGWLDRVSGDAGRFERSDKAKLRKPQHRPEKILQDHIDKGSRENDKNIAPVHSKDKAERHDQHAQQAFPQGEQQRVGQRHLRVEFMKDMTVSFGNRPKPLRAVDIKRAQVREHVGDEQNQKGRHRAGAPLGAQIPLSSDPRQRVDDKTVFALIVEFPADRYGDEQREQKTDILRPHLPCVNRKAKGILPGDGTGEHAGQHR